MRKKTVSHIPSAPLLELYRREIERCVKCGTCSAVCPTYLQERRESQSARGRMVLVKAVLDGKLLASTVFKDLLATCTTCLACESSCPNNVPVTKIIQAAKEQAVSELGPGIIDRIISSVLKHPVTLSTTAWLAPIALHYTNGNSEFSFQRSKGEKTGQGAKSKGKVAFFPGCAVNSMQKDIGSDVISVLSRIGYEVVIPEGLRCCGRPLLSLGNRKVAEELAAHNSSLFTVLRADAIITACASCGLTFKKEYPKLLRPPGNMPDVLDIHEFLAYALPGMPMGSVRRTVTYHDPCHLGRGQGLSGMVRSILRSLPGLSLVEMNNADRCCGFGGVMRITHQKLSDGIAEDKAKNIIATGASAVVTGCPGCRMQIAEALKRVGTKIEVLHTVQVVEEALRNAQAARSRRRTTGDQNIVNERENKK